MWRWAATAVVALSASALGQEQAWVTVSQSDGLVVQSRPAPDSSFTEFRVQARSALRPAALAALLWNPRRASLESKMFEHVVMLSESESERVEYLRIKPPLASRRDYTLRTTRSQDAAGRFRIDFRTDNEAGPAPNPDYVRIRVVRGSWLLEPDGDGTLVTHQVLSDPAGSIAPWMARSSQQSMAEAMVREVIALPGS